MPAPGGPGRGAACTWPPGRSPSAAAPRGGAGPPHPGARSRPRTWDAVRSPEAARRGCRHQRGGARRSLSCPHKGLLSSQERAPTAERRRGQLGVGPRGEARAAALRPPARLRGDPEARAAPPSPEAWPHRGPGSPFLPARAPAAGGHRSHVGRAAPVRPERTAQVDGARRGVRGSGPPREEARAPPPEGASLSRGFPQPGAAGRLQRLGIYARPLRVTPLSPLPLMSHRTKPGREGLQGRDAAGRGEPDRAGLLPRQVPGHHAGGPARAQGEARASCSRRGVSGEQRV